MKHPTVKQTEKIAAIIGFIVLLITYLSLSVFLLTSVVTSSIGAFFVSVLTAVALIQLVFAAISHWRDISG